MGLSNKQIEVPAELTPTRRRGWWRGLAWGAAALAVLFLLLVGINAWRDPAPVLADISILTAADKIHVGTPVQMRARVVCPFYRLPLARLAVTPPTGTQLLPGVTRRLCGIGWDGWRWDCRFAVQPYELTPKADGSLTVPLSPGRRGAAVSALTTPLPTLTVKPRVAEDDDALRSATRLSASVVETESARWWIIGGVVLVLVVAGVVFLLLRRRELRPAPPPPPPWDVALRAMQHLETRLPMPAEEFFVILTDLLRRYCDDRGLAVHATAATTPEFLAALRRSPLLNLTQQQALREFLTAADLIKFARAEATQDKLLDALHAGRRFVAETTPAPVAAAPGAPQPPAMPPAAEGGT